MKETKLPLSCPWDDFVNLASVPAPSVHGAFVLPEWCEDAASSHLLCQVSTCPTGRQILFGIRRLYKSKKIYRFHFYRLSVLCAAGLGALRPPARPPSPGRQWHPLQACSPPEAGPVVVVLGRNWSHLLQRFMKIWEMRARHVSIPCYWIAAKEFQEEW